MNKELVLGTALFAGLLGYVVGRNRTKPVEPPESESDQELLSTINNHIENIESSISQINKDLYGN